MRIFRSILLSLFFALFLHGRAHGYVWSFHSDITQVDVKRDPSSINKVHRVTKHAATPIVTKKHRKLKKKGIGAAVPFFPDLPFKDKLDYKECPDLGLNESYASFLHCVDGKRGPPLT